MLLPKQHHERRAESSDAFAGAWKREKQSHGLRGYDPTRSLLSVAPSMHVSLCR